MDRQTLTINLFRAEDNGVEMTLGEAVEWLRSIYESVPSEFRDRAFFSVELDYGYYDDPTSLDFQIYYNREETDEEAAERIADEERRKESSRQSEIARLRYNLARLESGNPS